MKYFVIFTLLAFICVMGYMDAFRYLINKDYWDGLKVVPIVMAAEMMMGVYFNLSFWYKLTDETKWGAYFSLIGLVITLVLQIVGVPRIGYWASCGSSLVCYLCIMLLSYFTGQKKAPVPYDLHCIGRYTLLTVGLLCAYYGMIYALHIDNMWAHMGIGTVLLGIYLYVLTKRDFPIKDYLYVFRNRRNHGSSR
jgi:O-antigen/teichoic acid export membrane protein